MEKGKFMEFNERLRYLIDCEEIKIKDLAPKLCLSASTLSNYTQGIREPDYDTLRRIADYFGVSIDYLLGHKSPVTDDERQLLALFRSFTPSQRRLLLEQSFDIVIVNAPLPDEFGTQLALELSETSGAGVLLLVKAEQYAELSARLTPNGILTLQKPTTPQLLTQTLQLLCGTRERLRRMEQKTASFEEKMAEIRLVNRAKCLLIERKAMTEQEAHRWIEKQAMDRCVSRKIIAEQILLTI